ncbi:MAG TPA: hypothetical protein PLL10_07015, partial [Elusimicrobiales bacterium]|nr:hypothetical protein [Elusimicrobiales bacterium]
MFGTANKKIKLKNCLGIYLSVEGAVISDVRQDGSSVRVVRQVRVPFAQVKRGSGETTRMSSLNAEFLDTETAWLEPLKKALSEGEWSSKKACVTLSSQFSVLRHFIMPMIAPRFRKQSVPFESKKYVPFPFEESFYDYYAYSVESTQPDQSRNTKMGVLFALTNKKVTQALTSGFQKLGLEILALETAPVSVSRLLSVSGLKAGPHALAHFNPSTACLIVSNSGVPVLFREVNFGDSQSTERRRLDLKGSIEFVGKQFGGAVSVGEVSVSGENLELWKNLVAEETKLPVSVWEPPKNAGLQEVEWGALSAAGAAASVMSDYPVDVDLRGKEKGDSDEKIAMMTLWIICGGLLGLVGAFCLMQQIKLHMLKKELVSEQSKTEIIQEFVGKKPEEINIQVEALKAKAKVLNL